MDKLYFSDKPEPSNKKKIVLCALGVVALVGVVAAFATLSSTPSTNYTLQQFAIEEQEFQGFMAKYNKAYANEEEYQARLKIFRDNYAYARVHNTLGRSYRLGITQFIDMTQEEFSSIYAPYKYQLPERKNLSGNLKNATNVTSWDWRAKGAVTPVGNQLQCGDGYAFAAAGAVEGIWFITNHTLVALSEQEIVDCSTRFGNEGCNGGLPTNSFQFAMAHGLTSNTNYPYKGTKGKCTTKAQNQPVANIISYQTAEANAPNNLMGLVVQQPITVVVQSNQAAWRMYTGGIISQDCGTDVDHSVLIVGFDNTNNPPYWIVKNSYGPSWGESGYLRIAITSGEGVCGINLYPAYPVR
ncbi:unnamed protein product [Blepharisma stoltei]|uniref:Uncharacterized protein n=1 Tax=Blepharisma stoltei TaxID=1481888 RepID=A0AAU9IMK6_9CILI|nr:unnamed protein product [Blepharisma stoltei]